MIQVLLTIVALVQPLMADTDTLPDLYQQYYEEILKEQAEEHKELQILQDWMDEHFMDTKGCISKCEEIISLSTHLMEKYRGHDHFVEELKYLKMHISDELRRLRQESDEDTESDDWSVCAEGVALHRVELAGHTREQMGIIDRLTVEADDDYQELVFLRRWLDEHVEDTNGCIIACKTIIRLSDNLIERYPGHEGFVENLEQIKMRTSDELRDLANDETNTCKDRWCAVQRRLF